MKPLAYALLQTTLTPPPVEKLRRAFRSVTRLVDADAHTLAADAYGILVKGLPAADAATLQGALKVEGIETDLVPQQNLPELPPGKLVQRLDCGPEALQVYDPLGRPFPVQWRQVLLIAAGDVRTTEFPRRQTTRLETRYTAGGRPYQREVVEVTHKEELNFKLRTDILLRGATARFQVEAGRFRFDYLGDRRRAETEENFTLLVRDLTRFAPHAAMNRGAFHLREEPPTLFPYPTTNAYQEEITWLLWHLRRVGKG